MTNFTRQLDIINPASLVYPITCIGLGGIGSFTAVTLLRMGFKDFTLYDHDLVDSHNIPCQHYNEGDVGTSKVIALAEHMDNCFKDQVDIKTRHEKFKDQPLEGMVVSGVDSMSSRQTIWNAVRKSRSQIPLYIDGRIGIEWDEELQRVTGEWIEIFSIRPSLIDDVEFYEPCLFSDEKSAELRCTAQSVVYVGNIISGLIAGNIKKWICGDKNFRRHILCDLLTLDILRGSV